MSNPTRPGEATRRNAGVVRSVAADSGTVRLIAGDSDQQFFDSLSEVGNYLRHREQNPLDPALI